MVAAVFSSWSMRSRELPEMPPGPSQDFFCSAALQLLLQQCEQVPSSHRGEKWLGRGHQVGMTRLRQLTCTSLNSIRYLQALILLGKANKALPWGQRGPGAGGSWWCLIYCGGDRQPGEGDRAVSWSAGHYSPIFLTIPDKGLHCKIWYRHKNHTEPHTWLIACISPRGCTPPRGGTHQGSSPSPRPRAAA